MSAFDFIRSGDVLHSSLNNSVAVYHRRGKKKTNKNQMSNKKVDFKILFYLELQKF